MTPLEIAKIIVALPDIIRLVVKAYFLLLEIFGPDWSVAIDKALAPLREMKTPEEKRNAARSILGFIDTAYRGK